MLRIWLLFHWYDFWVGVYVDRKNATLYMFPIPMFGIKIQYIPYDEKG